ncbi:MAG: LptF/LptG family permease [Chlamydiae bacterium]|nr:LptF/LptG family permease [Chlamydiota bacterium]MBI3267318.1 LptF/LptG family permease [Chlamydiota bacterium]
MKILHAYILRNFLLNFFIGIVVFVAVLFMGSMIKDIAGLLLQGVPLKDMGLLFLLLTPYFLSACIPLSLLTALLLVFGKLSQDNELLAIKASGVSLFQLCYPLWLIGLLLTGICFKLNNEIIPYSHYAARKLIVQMGVENPAAYLEPGNFVEIFPNHIIYIREREKDTLRKIVIYQTMAEGRVKTITAREGKISYDEKTGHISLELKDGNIQEPTGNEFKDFFNLQFGSYVLKLDTGKILKDPSNLDKKHKDMTLSEIKEKMKEYKSKGVNVTPLMTEIQKKISVSFSCFVFTLIGIPLGIRAHRSEKTIGVALSLLLVFFYYLFIIFGKALDEKPQFHPELLMWLPNILLGIIGIGFFRKVAR